VFLDAELSVIQALAKYLKSEHRQKKVLSLNEKSKPTIISNETKLRGNAVLLMLESPAFSFHNRASQQILNTVLSQPFFDTLRTKQQTSYLVQTWGMEKERILQNFFIAYSNTHDARDILARFELFIEDTVQKINSKTSEESFNTVKASLVKELSTPPQNMGTMFETLNLFAFEYNDFNWLDKRLAALKQVTFPQWVDLAIQTLGKGNNKRIAILNNSLNPESYHLRYLPLEGKIEDQGVYKSKEEAMR
ncbi:hypothetical protein AB751O23_BL_00010, partial [Chlamydiales bacterium SCGC AB-751-O23]